MFDFDKWQEIWSTIRANKLRTFLTACGVFWGIFMLIIMLGFGNGMEHYARGTMRGFAKNSVYVWGQSTSMPYKGLQPGREITFTNEDVEALRALPGIQYLAPRNQLGGFRGGNNVVRGDKTGNFQVMGDMPAFRHVELMNFEEGRFINELDIRDRRKVAVIGQHVKEVLFHRGEDPIGKYIRIQGIYFQVVGVFRSPQAGDMGERESNTLFIPFSTFQQTFHVGDKVEWFALTAKPSVSAKLLEKEVRHVLETRHDINPADRQALGSFNAAQAFGRVQGLFVGIRFFVWFVGIATLLAGVIGVSNIMLIVVKERTKEIGVRKAMGATPLSIISLVLQESVALTAVAGYLGLCAGVGLLAAAEMVGKMLGGHGPAAGLMSNLMINFHAALIATGILIVAGAVAGIMPARHAVRVNTVEALRSE